MPGGLRSQVWTVESTALIFLMKENAVQKKLSSPKIMLINLKEISLKPTVMVTYCGICRGFAKDTLHALRNANQP